MICKIIIEYLYGFTVEPPYKLRTPWDLAACDILSFIKRLSSL